MSGYKSYLNGFVHTRLATGVGMTGLAAIGLQFGDEGKGKIVDLLSAGVDAVVRCQGGSNAGHRVVIGGEEYKFRLVPSGILHPDVECVIGNGVVVDPEVLLAELQQLDARGIDVQRVSVSANAHVIMPYHLLLDLLEEVRLGHSRIGTTRRGIGPAYTDKAARLGIRVQDLLDEKILRRKIGAALRHHRLDLRSVATHPDLDLQFLVAQALTWGQQLASQIRDTTAHLWRLLDEGRDVLFEGAQGAMLDLDHGTYPYVTSSNPCVGGLSVGSGVGPKEFQEVWGVAKAYVTRVGSGPLPSEMAGPLADELRASGHEYGTVTGRPRRVGWVDLAALKYAARLNSVTHLAVTKLDVLTGIDPVPVAVGYEGRDGAAFEDQPWHQSVLWQSTSRYVELPGWSEDLGDCRDRDDLPPNAHDFLQLVEDHVGVPIGLIGVGPARDDVVWTEAGSKSLAARARIAR